MVRDTLTLVDAKSRKQRFYRIAAEVSYKRRVAIQTHVLLAVVDCDTTRLSRIHHGTTEVGNNFLFDERVGGNVFRLDHDV